ncbi:YbaB/EbfC family nucleoid-associated protein [Streptomyces hyaluromycini]|uniref:YbaB/EbfC family nucleoid-associated protein n=1 Tax=Streptomyces hyaluromycini TaxID=1377993 RepID=A0ABV1X3R9_9ACTN
MSGYEQEIDRLLADYRARRDEADSVRRRINEVTGTATAPRRVVKVTVSARGELVDIDFPTGAFRRMTPRELADVLKTTIAEARAAALSEIDSMVFDHVPLGLSPSALLSGTADIGRLLPAEPESQEAMRDFLKHGLFETRRDDS